MTIRETIGKEAVQELRNRLENVLDGDKGFIILVDDKRGMDYYQNYCAECVKDKVEYLVDDADALGLLPIRDREDLTN